MKKLVSLLLAMLMALTLCACSNKTVDEETQVDEQEEVLEEEYEEDEEEYDEFANIAPIESDDKHIAYMKNYVGKNCATIGYTAMSGDRNDYISDNAYITLVLNTPDGSYIDIEDIEVLKQYMVVAQSIEPNTKVNIEFKLDPDGNEYNNLINFQSVEEVVLQVKKVGEEVTFDNELVSVKQAENRHLFYIPNFVGRNLASCGYISMAGDLRFRLGAANCKIVVVASDGSYVEMEKDALKNYVVYEQNIEPNSEFKVEYKLDSEGKEYDNLIEHQSYEEIELYVKPIEQ